MPSEMAANAAREFAKYVDFMDEPNDGMHTYNSMFINWLHMGGMALIGEDYGLAVETLLVILSEPPKTDVPAVSVDDPNAWDYMTETGFRFEVYSYRHRDIPQL